MRHFKSVELWCFLLLVLNVATAGTDLYFRRAAAYLAPFPLGKTISAQSGITAGGSSPSAGEACHLVRYASIYCNYCSPKFSKAWSDLEAALSHRGCSSIIVSPYSGDLPLSDGKTPEQRLVGVSVPFVKSTLFNSTPITLLVDRNWKIVWAHIGVLGDEDNEQALQLGAF